jgi:DNA-binding transcriptional LysR family regulator
MIGQSPPRRRSTGQGWCAVSFRRGHLRYFVTVADEGQITRAAAKLHMAQPALSLAVAQLESELGVKLLHRHARGVTLTPAGRVLYEKASLAVAAQADAAETAQAMARTQSGSIEFGFLGAPPGLDSPASLAAFGEEHPAIQIRYRDLPFPSTPTSSWLSEVDVAVCHKPPEDPNVWQELLRHEPRVVLAPRSHPLAERERVAVGEVLGQTFIGFHPSIDPAWAGYWSLDDCRGGPPPRVTVDRATNPQEVLASLAARDAITTAPASVAGVIVSVLPSIVSIPLSGAAPATITLVGHKGHRNPLVATIVSFVRAHSRP